MKIEVAKRTGEARKIEDRAKAWVDKQMKPENIKIEYL